MTSNPTTTRLTLLQLRAIVAVHGGRVEVRPGTTPNDNPTFVLRGRGLVLALLATGGTVDRMLVLSWVRQIRFWDHRSLGAEPAEKSDGAP